MTKGKMVQKVKREEQDIHMSVGIVITPADIERLNKLGLKDNVKQALFSDVIRDAIDNLYHEPRYLGDYVLMGAEEEKDTGKQSPKTVNIAVRMKAADYERYLRRCIDMKATDIGKQAGEDLAGLGYSHCMPEV